MQWPAVIFSNSLSLMIGLITTAKWLCRLWCSFSRWSCYLATANHTDLAAHKAQSNLQYAVSILHTLPAVVIAIQHWYNGCIWYVKRQLINIVVLYSHWSYLLTWIRSCYKQMKAWAIIWNNAVRMYIFIAVNPYIL